MSKLRNRGAELVYSKVERFLAQHDDFCKCEQCVLDLLAYVLNHATPLYGTSLLDPFKPDPELEKRIRVEIDLALQAGSRRVRRHPKHEDSSRS